MLISVEVDGIREYVWYGEHVAAPHPGELHRRPRWSAAAAGRHVGRYNDELQGDL